MRNVIFRARVRMVCKPSASWLASPAPQAMDAVPVLAGGYGHSRDREKFVQFVKRGREAAPPGNSGGGAYLHRLIKGCAEKEPGQEGHQRGVGGGVVDGTAHHQAVSGLKLRRDLVDGVVKDALALFCALAAGDAATNGLVPDLNDLGFNPLCLKTVSISRRAREVYIQPKDLYT